MGTPVDVLGDVVDEVVNESANNIMRILVGSGLSLPFRSPFKLSYVQDYDGVDHWEAEDATVLSYADASFNKGQLFITIGVNIGRDRENLTKLASNCLKNYGNSIAKAVEVSLRNLLNRAGKGKWSLDFNIQPESPESVWFVTRIKVTPD